MRFSLFQELVNDKALGMGVLKEFMSKIRIKGIGHKRPDLVPFLWARSVYPGTAAPSTFPYSPVTRYQHGETTVRPGTLGSDERSTLGSSLCCQTILMGCVKLGAGWGLAWLSFLGVAQLPIPMTKVRSTSPNKKKFFA